MRRFPVGLRAVRRGPSGLGLTNGSSDLLNLNVVRGTKQSLTGASLDNYSRVHSTYAYLQ